MNLRDYLHFKKIKANKFAVEIGITPTYLRLIKNQGIRPSLKLAKLIEMVTGGEVTANEIRGSDG